MGRALRPHIPDGVYNCSTRGVRRLPIVHDDRDRRAWLGVLQYVVELHGWRCPSYCLMTNHWHAVFQTPKADISAGIHRLNWLYAYRFNERHGFSGHLFEDRFNSVLVESDRQLLEAARYVELNPVRAALCADPADWAWSSHRATIGAVRPPSFLDTSLVLEQFSEDPALAARRYRAFVMDAILLQERHVLV
jgi:putative transposase